MRKRHEEDRLRAADTSIPFGLVGLGLAGDPCVAGSPERMFLAAVPILIARGRNLLPRGALTFLERIWIGRHDFVFLDGLGLALFFTGVFASDALLRNASLRRSEEHTSELQS